MKDLKVNFKNSEGETLSGYLELPLNGEPHNYALFAHCFTCNKNFHAVRNITETLAQKGFGVLRFDFTGLGESEGDFADTNFSGNVQDLIAAANFLEKEHKAPSLIIGHSLGGAAAIFAANKLSSVKAVTTIAAPSSPAHVTHLLKSDLEEIKEKGVARVDIGCREFTIKEQFLKDLHSKELKTIVHDFDKALLILHSPQDKIVGIDNAEEIYVAAHHPKSFVSLDGADHLLNQDKDSGYAGEVIAAWSSRYIEPPKRTVSEDEELVVANLGEKGLTTQIMAGEHYFLADEPKSAGGKDHGPTPYELLSAGLAACTSMTVQMYARRKKWELLNVETQVKYSRSHAKDCENCEEDTAKVDQFERALVMEGKLDKDQKKKLLEIAGKCPVHKTLSKEASINTFLKNKKEI